MSNSKAFESFVTTVGTNGTLTLPLLSSDTAGIPTLRVGPNYTRNGVRYFVRMPSLTDAQRLPAPMSKDLLSITFEPVFIYLDGPLPPHCSAEFYRVTAGRSKGKINKKPIHQWSPGEGTAIYPCNRIQIESLAPGETIQFHGSSYWFNPSTNKRHSPQKNPFYWPLPAQPPPPVQSQYPISLLLLVKMKWLPKEVQRKQFRVVRGSPVDWTQPATPMASDPDPADTDVRTTKKTL